jgi:hypothetical protein
MMRARALLASGLIAAAWGCGADPAAPEAAAPARAVRTVTGLAEDETGWIPAEAVVVDGEGVVWVDARAEVLGGRDPRLEGLPRERRVFVGRTQGNLHVGLDRLAPEAVAPRERPREGRWVPARSLTDVVRRIRGGEKDLALPAPRTAAREGSARVP